MKKTDVYPAGDFLKAARDGSIDTDGNPATLRGTIASLTTHEFEDGRKQRVLHFVEDIGVLGLNVTNWDTIAGFTGKDDDDAWTGTVIEIFVVPERMSKTGQALRVRRPPAAQRTATPQPSNGKVADPNSPKTLAWKAFCLATPEMDKDTRSSAFVLATQQYFGEGFEPSEIGAQQWAAFVTDLKADWNPIRGFPRTKRAKVTVENPITQERDELLEEAPF